MNQDNRTEKRRPLQKECVLENELGSIEAQTVDMSKMGLGVKTDRTLPFKFINGSCELAVFIQGKGDLPPVKIMWVKKDSINTTRLGLKFLHPLKMVVS